MEGGPAIPHGSSSPHHYHVDTCYLRPILIERDDDRDLLEAARRLVNRADGRGVCASVGVVGETIIKADANSSEGQLSSDDLECMGRNLARYIRQGRIALCSLGSADNSEVFFRRALDIRRADGRIGDMDVLILASALGCPDCEVLYTNDGPMLNSTSLRAIAQEKPLALREAPGDPISRRRRGRPGARR
jgi:hypothetical protein